MGQIKNSIVLEKALRTEFMKSFDNGENPADVMPMIMQTASTSGSEKYGWLGSVPQLREWKDSRKLSGILDFDYSIPNVHYESTLQVDRDDIEDDQYGAIKVRIQDLARRAKTHPRKKFFELLSNGEVGLAFDGVAFYSASHKYTADSAAQSNLHTGTKAGTVPTAAELSADFELARGKMRKFVDDQGEPFNEGSLDLMIVASPDLEGVLDRVFGAELLDNATNTLKGASKYMTSGRLTGSNWYIVEMSGNLKPFIQQNRQAPRFGALEATSEHGFMHKTYKYGIDYRVGFGYGLWQKSIKVKY
jgi:phage major head subunit gpT-like protein